MNKFADKNQEAVFKTAKGCIGRINEMLTKVEDGCNTFNEVLDLYNITEDDFNKLVSVCCLIEQKSGSMYKETSALVSDLGLTARTVNALHRNDIVYVTQLLNTSYKEIRRFRNLGVTSLIQLVDVLKEEYGYKLTGENLRLYELDVNSLEKQKLKSEGGNS